MLDYFESLSEGVRFSILMLAIFVGGPCALVGSYWAVERLDKILKRRR